jgi:hypothetical protein
VPAFLALLPALIAAAGTVATSVGAAVSNEDQIKSQNEIAAKQRQQQTDMARKQAIEQSRQRIESERSANSEMFQQGVLNQSRTQQQGAQGRVAARQGAVGTIQRAFS